MPRHRLPYELWQEVRQQIWQRDGGYCRGPYCRDRGPLSFQEAHIDHIQSGKLGSNALKNLRVLCRRCHVLRLDSRHRGMIGSALRDGIIPPNWREFAWSENRWPDESKLVEMARWSAAQATSNRTAV